MRTIWGVKWRSDNRLDGYREHLMNEQCLPVLFLTRHRARVWIRNNYGYLRRRPDLRAEPHGWQMPIAVRVTVRESMTTGSHGAASR